MDAELLLKAGRVDEALSSLQAAIRNKPEDPKLRVFLFQMTAVLGQWDRAMTQLQLLESIQKETEWLGKLFQPVVQAEFMRSQVFSGKVTPMIFGEPEEWMSWQVKACSLMARGNFAAAKELRQKVLDSAPAAAGTINGQPFDWIMDADPRFGPFLEVIMSGTYYWVPFTRIKQMHSEKPSDLRDLVWLPVNFIWTNGGEMSGHVPVRYPGTETFADSELRLARRTDWIAQPDGSQFGVGQRLLATDKEDLPLLEVRDLQFTQKSAPAAEVVP